MILSVSLDIAPAASAQDRPSLARRSAGRSTEIPSEDLVEMLYLQYLAQRELQELFENGALQALES